MGVFALASPRYRLTKKNRIGERTRIRELVEQGGRKQAEHVVIRYLVKNEGVPRLAVLTPKRLGKAVVRNKIKRRTRELFRLYLPLYTCSFDVLVFPKTPFAVLEFNVLKEEFEGCFRSAGLL